MKSRPFFEPRVPVRTELTELEYGDKTRQSGGTINHFHEKLLKLSSMMKTKSGRERAEKRQQFMQQFMAQFYSEMSEAGVR